jgi:hypothetical protein
MGKITSGQKIPRIIHYCWFGGKELSPLAQRCIASWKKYCPDYEIKRWDESNVDLDSCAYVKEAYQAKKWAFVSDFVRFYVLYEFGGVYFDVDVELIKPLEPIIFKGPFMSIESYPGCFSGGNDDILLNPGQGIAAEKNNPFYKEIIDYYKTINFITDGGTQNTKTVGQHVTELFLSKGLRKENKYQVVNGINIWPKEYFNPVNPNSGRIEISEETVSIHHYAGTWVDKKTRIRDKCFQFVYRVFGKKIADGLKKKYRKVFK